MNLTTKNLPSPVDEQKQRRLALTGILEHTVRFLELTPNQYVSVEKTYRECGEHLSMSLGLAPERGEIFPQGSMRLGTAIRPFRDITEVFDLDLVFQIVRPCTTHDPRKLRELVGTHLRSKYNDVIKELPKGWRLDFSHERDYHLDVIPAMSSTYGDGVIAITDSSKWLDSNPRGYADWFERNASILPQYAADEMLKEGRAILNCASIEPLPEYTNFKSPLHRIVQIVKRHRDYYFNKKTEQSKFLTASIIVTTLLTKAYASRVPGRIFESDFDVLLACLEDMVNHIEMRSIQGANRAWLPNPSLPTENLLGKWSSDTRFAQEFHNWHRDIKSFLRGLLSGGGRAASHALRDHGRASR